MKLTFEERRTIAEQWDGSPLNVQGTSVVENVLDQLSDDLVKMGLAQRKMVKTIESTDFKELEEYMRKSARQMGKSLGALPERALFINSCQLGRNKSNMDYFERLVWSAETQWRQQLQIDMDYAEYCVGLDNHPDFLSWCINQMHRKTATLGATKPCVTRI